MNRDVIAHVRSDGRLVIIKDLVTGDKCKYREIWPDGKAHCDAWNRIVKKHGCYCHLGRFENEERKKK